MICETVRLPDGVAAIVCSGRGRRRKRCACGGLTVALCDYPIQLRDREGDVPEKTCDKPLCTRCAVRVAKNVDYCREHPLPKGAQLTLF